MGRNEFSRAPSITAALGVSAFERNRVSPSESAKAALMELLMTTLRAPIPTARLELTDESTDPVAADPSVYGRVLLRRSFNAVLADPRRFSQRFYARLFELAPAARALFPAELGPQQQKLVQAVVVLIRGLDDPAVLVPMLGQLGLRHAGYGVVAAHYAWVGEALVDTLNSLSAHGLSCAERQAWMQLYGWVAASMLAGAAGTPSTE